MTFRFREWGSTDWTYIYIEGELDAEAFSIIGSGLARYHCQQRINGAWENL